MARSGRNAGRWLYSWDCESGELRIVLVVIVVVRVVIVIIRYRRMTVTCTNFVVDGSKT